MKHLFIVNPVAGGKDRTAEVTASAREVFADCPDDYEIYVTKEPMDAAREVSERAASGEEYRIYSCGGDGTFNEVVCGSAGHSNVSVTPFPVGTGNDFCRMFGKEQELFRNLRALVRGTIHPIDAIDCNGRLCVNLASVGIDARIGCNVHKYSSLPLIGGATAYVVSAVVEMFRGITTPMKIQCGSFSSAGKETLACVCNGRFYGGGFNPSPTARPDDGELDIIIAHKVSLLEFASLIGKYAKGHADKLKDKAEILHSREIRIEFEEPQIVNLDGEAIYAQIVEMKLIPGAVNLIVPEGMTFFEEA